MLFLVFGHLCLLGSSGSFWRQFSRVKYIYIYIYIYIKIDRSTKIFVFFEFIYLFILFLHTCMLSACCFRQRTYMAQDLLMGYSMRLELTRVCSLNNFQLVISLDKSHSLFFWEYVYLSLLFLFGPTTKNIYMN